MQATVTTKNGKQFLTVVIPMQTPTLSSTGKSLVVATTGGNKECSVQIDGKSLKVGINAYIPA